MPKIYSTSFVNSDSQSVYLTYPKLTCEIPHSLCHDPRQAPYTPNIPRTLSHDLRQVMLHNVIDIFKSPTNKKWGVQWNPLMFPVESSHLLDNPLMIWPITAYLLIFLYFYFYVEPWDRGTFFKWPLSRKGQEATKGCPLNRGSVAGELLTILSTLVISP